MNDSTIPIDVFFDYGFNGVMIILDMIDRYSEFDFEPIISMIDYDQVSEEYFIEIAKMI